MSEHAKTAIFGTCIVLILMALLSSVRDMRRSSSSGPASAGYYEEFTPESRIWDDPGWISGKCQSFETFRDGYAIRMKAERLGLRFDGNVTDERGHTVSVYTTIILGHVFQVTPPRHADVKLTGQEKEEIMGGYALRDVFTLQQQLADGRVHFVVLDLRNAYPEGCLMQGPGDIVIESAPLKPIRKKRRGTTMRAP